ncbi:Aste57867_2533 [Aphanomyces stellatus]|uniref:Aste57867_2533 protein n=1 Tax=Aphanomyces stellatus TaxID=120398 RepID=A0A485KBI1_9STRA|nr:hypothetical protein As57867_002526 [Aphanomyces stellatus]VFT79732.1 Aste57867_2533 [Aphanomyces stellatus]
MRQLDDVVTDSFWEDDGATLWMLVWRSDGVMFETTRRSQDKPRSLTCSGDAFLQALHGTFHDEAITTAAAGLLPAFREGPDDVLLVDVTEERDGVHLRYDSWTMTRSPASSQDRARCLWCREYAAQEDERRKATCRVAELEDLVRQKDALLDDAIAAKAETETRLVQQCMQLLNAKKSEIQRLRGTSKRGLDLDEVSDEENDDVAEGASQAYEHLPVSQTHVSAKRVLDEEEEFLDML